MLAVDVVDEKVGVQYFVVHCECASAHRNGYRVVCELGTIETFGGSGGLLAIVEGDALLGAVIDGGEGEAGYQAATGNATISRGLNRVSSWTRYPTTFRTCLLAIYLPLPNLLHLQRLTEYR